MYVSETVNQCGVPSRDGFFVFKLLGFKIFRHVSIKISQEAKKKLFQELYEFECLLYYRMVQILFINLIHGYDFCIILFNAFSHAFFVRIVLRSETGLLIKIKFDF